jgi:4-amino-4-deoxy-L-arabinose transferase-like glycosyltransferase
VIRSRRLPLPLLAVLGVTLVAGFAWALAVPALQGADEGAHFAYVQKIADAHTIPWPRKEYGLLQSGFFPSVSTEQSTAWTWAGLEMLRGNQAAKPLWTKEDERIWAEQNAKLTPADRRDGQGSQAFRNPPVYYLTAAVPYKIVGGSFFDRLFAIRIYNVALLLATVALTWLLAGELFARRREFQTVAAAAVALQPVLLDTMTRVTPDALLIPLSSAVLYLMVLVVRRGPTLRLSALLVAATVLACFTQGRAIGLVPPVLFAFGLALYRRYPDRLPRAPGRVGSAVLWVGAIVGVAVLSALWATRFAIGQLGGFWSYLWQFYLPPLPGMSDPVGPHWTATNVYLDRFFGTFVQFEVALPTNLLDGLRAIIYVGLVAMIVSAVRHRDALRERRDVVVTLLVASVLVVLSLHAASFHALLANPADPVFTGRYLLMLIPLYGIGVAAALTGLPGRLRAGASGAVLAGLFLLQISAFGLVVARFYA